MTRMRRIFSFVFVGLLAVLILAGGTWVELNIFNWVDVSTINPALTHVGVFFGVLNLNLLLLSVFVFLVFKNAVRLAVDRKKGVFGSSLRTKLVTAFVFFALLPTVILLFMTSKFVNANFDKWMPANLVEVSTRSALAERNYQEKVSRLLQNVHVSDLKILQVVDFTFDARSESVTARPEFSTDVKEKLRAVILASSSRLEAGKPKWFSAGPELFFALRRVGPHSFIGVVAPPTIHAHWQLLEKEFASSGPGVELLRLSYYLMLGVLTLLILFSATWLGLTIAREYTGPIAVLAGATDRVAQGDYSVEIDEIISDDEMGQLAQSFRSMVNDLREGHESAAMASRELAKKADELLQNSEYNAFLISHVNSAVVVVSQLGLIESWNDQAEKVFGVHATEALGKLVQDVFERDLLETMASAGFALAPSPPLLPSDLSSNLEQNPEHLRAGVMYRGVLAGREKQLQIKISTHIATQGSTHHSAPAAAQDQSRTQRVQGLTSSQRQYTERIIIIEDLTELARAQRVAAWRDVARRVAHEIKNPLTPITLGVQRLQRRFQSRFEGPDLEVFQDSVRIVLDSTDSIRRLVEEFIRFARMPQALLQKGNIIEAAQLALAGMHLPTVQSTGLTPEFAAAHEQSEGSPVPLEVFLDHSDRSAEGLEERHVQQGEPSVVQITPEKYSQTAKNLNAFFDKDQIVRMLGNLVANALEALHESAPQESSGLASNGELDSYQKPMVRVQLILCPNQSQCVFRVLDNGPGIPKQIRAKIFEPYFSTRRKGSGLGLPIVRQIVAEHRGEITVLDHEPQGTEFRIALPILVSERKKVGDDT